MTCQGGCAPAGKFTGWHTFTALWQSNKVTFWYDSTLMGSETLRTTAAQQLVFDDASAGSSFGSSCPSCFGPALYPSTVYLNWVQVWSR